MQSVPSCWKEEKTFPFRHVGFLPGFDQRAFDMEVFQASTLALQKNLDHKVYLKRCEYPEYLLNCQTFHPALVYHVKSTTKESSFSNPIFWIEALRRVQAHMVLHMQHKGIDGLTIAPILASPCAFPDDHILVKKLDLTNNQLEVKGLHKVLEAMTKNTWLYGLALSCNPTREKTGFSETSSLIARMLSKNKVLFELVLNHMGLGDEGVRRIIANIPKQLYTLSLSGNNIGNLGAKFIGDALSKTNLLHLRLGSNFIGDQGIEYLCAGCGKLKTLTLDGNLIGDAGTPFISNLIVKGNLHTLNLEHNQIGNAGFKELSKALSHDMNHLSSLNLVNNFLNDGALEAMRSVIDLSRFFTIIDVGKNPLSPKVFEELFSVGQKYAETESRFQREMEALEL
jgi:hypothetical protein